MSPEFNDYLSFSGKKQFSLLPNHRNRFFAIHIYTKSLINRGIILNIHNKFQGKERLFIILSAASDRRKILFFSIRITVSSTILFNEYFSLIHFDSSDWKGRKENSFFLSLFLMNLTVLLQRLQYPS